MLFVIIIIYLYFIHILHGNVGSAFTI